MLRLKTDNLIAHDHYRLVGYTGLSLLLLAAQLSACIHLLQPPSDDKEPAASQPVPEPRAFEITGDEHLMSGENAEGHLGDFRLQNERIAVIVQKAGADRGGHIIDMAPRGSSHDELGVYLAYGDGATGRKAVYTEVAIVNDGSGGGVAVIEARGHDSEHQDLAITTQYRLPADGPAVEIHTTLLNRAQAEVRALELHDSVNWGSAETGLAAAAKKSKKSALELDWVLAKGKQVSYGWLADERKPVDQRGGSMEVTFGKSDLSMGWKTEFQRTLAVADGDPGALVKELLAAKRLPARVVSGKVAEHGSGASVADATVEIYQKLPGVGEVHFGSLKADGAGRYSGEVAPGEYELRPSAPGRARVGGPFVFIAANDKTELDLTLSKKASIRFDVTDDSGTSIPARIVVTTPKGEVAELAARDGASSFGASVFAATGSGVVDVAPGSYDIRISRGPAFEIFDTRVTARAGQDARVKAKLETAFKTAGWESMDYAVRDAADPGCDLGVDQQLVRASSNGIGLGVGASANRPYDLQPAASELGLGRTFVAMTGAEVSASGTGRFLVFPVPTDAKWSAKTGAPSDVLGELRAMAKGKSVLIATSPMSAGGYLTAMSYSAESAAATNPAMSWDFDAIEVFDGSDSGETDAAVRAWFRMLDQGRRIIAVAAHPGCSKGAPEGFARTWVAVANPNSSSAVVESIQKRRAAFVSNGPFVQMSLDKVPMGGEVVGKRGKKGNLSIEVSAASWVKVDTVELVTNGGDVVRTWNKLRPRAGTVLSAKHRVDLGQAAWYVVRVRGKSAMAPLSDQVPFALSNPIWVTEPPAPKKPAEPKVKPPEPPPVAKGKQDAAKPTATATKASTVTPAEPKTPAQPVVKPAAATGPASAKPASAASSPTPAAKAPTVASPPKPTSAKAAAPPAEPKGGGAKTDPNNTEVKAWADREAVKREAEAKRAEQEKRQQQEAEAQRKEAEQREAEQKEAERKEAEANKQRERDKAAEDKKRAADEKKKAAEEKKREAEEKKKRAAEEKKRKAEEKKAKKGKKGDKDSGIPTMDDIDPFGR